MVDVLCEKDDCKNEATVRYVWPWGEEGLVCDDHRGHTEQLAQQLGRTIAFTPLATARPPAGPDPNAGELLEQLRHAAEENQELRAALEKAQQEHVRLSNELGALKRLRSVRQVDSDVEEATASTDPTESPHATQSPPAKPRHSR